MLLVLLPVALALPDAALSGAWRITPDRPTVQADVDAAVEVALAPFNVAIRAIARPRLAAAATFCDRYDLALTATQFTITCDGGPSATATFDGAASPVPAAPDPTVRVTGQREDADVRLEFQGADGWQRTRYTPAADGSLTVEKTLHSSRLDRDVTWTMVYRRP